MTRIEIHLDEEQTERLGLLAKEDNRLFKNFCETEIKKVLDARTVLRGGKWAIRPKITPFKLK